MKSYTRRTFLKLCAFALPGLTVLSKIPIPKSLKGKSFWVSEIGSDFNLGTQDAPFRTVERAIKMCNRRAGDMIFLLPGSYKMPILHIPDPTITGLGKGKMRPVFIGLDKT